MAEGQPGERRTSAGRTLVALTGAALSALFLANLTFGIIEIPDNLPFVGNIDEVFASAILFSCLSQLGINLLPFYRAVKEGRVTLPGDR